MHSIDLLKYVIQSLNDIECDYLIGGSHVLGIYANARTSRDIDIIVRIKEADLQKFFEIFPASQFHLNKEAAIIEIKRKGMFNIVSEATGYKIDFFIDKETPFYQEQFKRKQRKVIFGIDAWVCSKEDLVLAKLMWIQQIQSELQMRDIVDLMELKDIDKSYLNKWIQTLNLKTFGLI